MPLSTCTGTTPNNVFKLRGGATQTFTATEADKVYICKSANILQKLYEDFTADQTVNISAPLSGTSIATAVVTKPGSCLRILPTTSNIRDLFFAIDKLDASTTNIPIKTQMKNILLQENNSSQANLTPLPLPSDGFDTATNFKGIYGLINAVNLLKSKINTTIVQKSQSSGGEGISLTDETNQRLDYITTFYEKKQSKDTLEEISYRENQIYREKFLYIILLFIGLFMVGSQLRERYFSNVSFSGSDGLFSGFGGFGRTFSGPSIGNLFSSSAYSLKTR
jgi:hypothetical protein